MDIKKIVNENAKYEKQVCSACKEKLDAEAKKLTKWDLLRPQKISKRFMKLLCPMCLENMKGALHRDGKI